MSHRVSIGRSGFLDLLKVHAEGFRCSLDLIGRAGEAYYICLESRNELCQFFGRITFGVNRDKERLDFGGIGAERIHDSGNLCQGRGAHIGAIRKAEEDEQPAPCEVFVRLHYASVIGQFEVSLERGRISALFFSDRKLQKNGPNNHDRGKSPKHFL